MIRPGRFREPLVVASAAAALVVALTYPLAFEIGTVARTDSSDGKWSIWVVNWVARTLIADPRHLYDANIFYPHRDTLAYSESNIGTGVLALPVYWVTRNPIVTHNFVVLLSFWLSFVGMYTLVRRLTGVRAAAGISALAFAFCPFVFGRLPHIHLLITAGFPFTMLAFHRLIDRPGFTRSAVLAGTLVAVALSSGYYGVFAGLMVVPAGLYFAAAGRTWRRPGYWGWLAAAAAMTAAVVLPLFLPYLDVRSTGFRQTVNLDEVRQFSADWRAYLASAAHAHRWMLGLLGHWKEVLFPGFAVTILAVLGASAGLRRQPIAVEPDPVERRPSREVVGFYALLAVWGAWFSFGPDAGLYLAIQKVFPVVSMIRAPSRAGILVTMALAVLAGAGVSQLLRYVRRTAVLAFALGSLVLIDTFQAPLFMPKVPPFSKAYTLLAGMPRGVVIEFPFPYKPMDLHRHTEYMMYSTVHWMPLVNGYSDYIPPDFLEIAVPVNAFPSPDSCRILEARDVRYVLWHLRGYNPDARRRLEARFPGFRQYLRPLYQDDDVWLYERLGCPSGAADRGEDAASGG